MLRHKSGSDFLTIYMYQRIRVSQQTQHNQRPDQTNIILDQIAQQEQVGRRDSYNPTKARTSLQPATSRNSAARQSRDFPIRGRAGNQEIPSFLPVLLSPKKKEAAARFLSRTEEMRSDRFFFLTNNAVGL